MYNFTEKDWKLFRAKLPKWQENYMEKLVIKYAGILSSSKLASEKFWELEKLINKDKTHTGVTVVMSRSRMLENIISLISKKSISIDDLSEYSDELKSSVSSYLNYKG